MAANTLTLNQVAQDGGAVTLYAVMADESGNVFTNTPPETAATQIEAGKDCLLSPESYSLFEQTGEGIAYTALVDTNRIITNRDWREVKAALTKLIQGMIPADLMKLVAMDSTNSVQVDFTAEKHILTQAVDNLARGKMNRVGIFSAIDQSLNALRTTQPGFPKRHCLIIFTYGAYSPTYSLDEINGKVAAAGLPIYVVGLKGPGIVNEKVVTIAQHNSRLSSMNQIARRSNGHFIMTIGITVAEATDIIIKHLKNTLVYTVAPPYEKFGLEDIAWSLILTDGNIRTQSNEIKAGLSLAGVPTPVPKPTLVPTSTPAPTPTLTPPPEPGFFEGPALIIIIIVVVVLMSGTIALLITKQRKISSERLAAADEILPNEIMWETPVIGEDVFTLQSADEEGGTVGLLDPDELTAAIPSMQRPMMTLAFTEEYNGHSRVLERAISTNLVIGRGKECNIMLEDRTVSRKHCKLTLEGSDLYLEDMGSRSGSFVNQQPAINRVPLRNGDTIHLGMTTLSVSIKQL